MASDLPTAFDVVVVGTGMSESILAAAFSRIGQQVLHVDKNDFYSGQWASFNLEGIEKWSRRAFGEDQLQPTNVDTSTLLKDGEQLMDMPLLDDSYSNIKITFHVKDGETTNSSEENAVVPVPDKCDECREQETDVEKVVIKCSDKISETRTSLQENSDQIVTENSDKASETKIDLQKVSDQNKDTESTVKNDADTEKSSEEKNENSGDVESSSNQESELQDTSLQNTESLVKPAYTDSDKSSQENKDVLASSENKSEHLKSTDTDDKRAVNSTEDDKMNKEWNKSTLKKEWRKFNLDLAPRLLYSRGSMVELLITSEIAKYCEFKTVTRMLTLLNGKLEKVPCSRADVFSSKDVSMLEKRMLMKFLTFCNDYQSQPQEWTEFRDRPFIEYLIHKKLTNNIKHFIQHSIAMVTDDISTEQGLSKTQKFLHSLGRYGNTAFLWSLYGSGEMPQSFCRMCAVFGGLYCLRMSASSLIVDKDNKCCGVITTEGQRIDCKWLIIEKSSAPRHYLQQKENRSLSRAILITDRSILTSESQELSLLRLPDPNGGQPITVLELPPSSMACPPGVYVVQISRDGTDTTVLPENDLSYAVQTLFNDDENKDGDKPNILWSLYYSHAVCEEIDYTPDSPDNVIIMSGPGSEIDMDRPVNEARKIFERLMPDEDFLPRPPNPEDIIYVDETEATVGEENSQSEFAESADKTNQSEHVEQTKNEQSKEKNEKQDCDQTASCDKSQSETQDLKSDQSDCMREDSLESQTNKTSEQEK